MISKSSKMGHTFKAISEWMQRIGLFLINRVSGPRYVLIFIGTILFFAVLYYGLSQCGHGIGSTEKSAEVSFLQGLYFSVVTISSLGYGDLHPMGVSKVLASIEVILGLGLVGIMIAKFTSQRLFHYVARLFGSDAKQRLEEIAKEITTSKVRFDSLIRELPQDSPNNPTAPSEDADFAVQENFSAEVMALAQKCSTVRDYFSEEAPLDDYFKSVPKRAFISVGESLNGALSNLNQLLASFSRSAIGKVFNESNRHMLSVIRESQQEVVSMVIKSIQDEFTHHIFKKIEGQCQALKDIENYYSIPEQLPGQRVPDSDAPQST